MGVLIGPNTLYYVIVRPKGKLREDFDFSDEKVRKPALLRPEMGERGTGDMATTVIAITNQKGGVGKTTTAAALLTGLHRRGAAVLGVDMDPQGSLGFSLGLDIEHCTTIYDVFRGQAEPEQAIVRTDTCDILPSNILLSGAELDLNILANPMVLLIGAVYIASRSLGKISGSYVSCKATRCSEKIQKYLGITLLPQAGVALGMAAEAAELSDGHMVRNVVLFSVLVYELVGPTLAKLSLTAAGEIIPEGRTSARTTNKPEEPVSVD